MGQTPVFLHLDLDAFYAAVECLDDPGLVGKPLVVGARPGQRGVVSSCSYEARRFGIHSAMPVARAQRLCPQAVFRPVRMQRYLELSQEVMGILAGYAPVFRRISIDEASIDLTGTERLYGPPGEVARKIKEHVRRDTGLTLSVGVASNRYVAKIASERCKPDGLLVVRPGEEAQFMESLALEKLWGVGERTRGRLLEAGIGSVSALREYSQASLGALMGEACGRYLYLAVRGEDPGMGSDTPRSRSISAELTFETDLEDDEALSRALLELSEEVIFRLLREGLDSNTATLKLRTFDFLTTTAQRTVKHRIGSSAELHSLVLELLKTRWDGSTPVRLVGVGVANVAPPGPGGARQGELFDDSLGRKRRVEETVTRLKERLDGVHLTKASLLDAPGGRGPAGSTSPAPGPPSGRLPARRRGPGSPPAER